MISGQAPTNETFRAQIQAEIRNIHSKPLGYDSSKLLGLLDEFELDPLMSIQEYNETYAVIHLLAHLINLDFNNAKFLVKRFDENLRKNERVQAISKMLKAILQKRYEEILIHFRESEALLRGTDDTQALAEALLPILRFYILRVLTKTFETLPLKNLSAFLNLNLEDGREYLIRNGWKVVDNEYMRAPEKVEISDREFREITEAQFKNLSQTISFLETI